jgi:hypothetical protein
MQARCYQNLYEREGCISSGINKVGQEYMLLKDILNYLSYLIQPKAGIADIVIVRRYPDATGSMIGEIYIDGKQIGNSCDKFINAIEFIKQPIYRRFNSIGNNVYNIKQYDFISGAPQDVCYVDCINDLMHKLEGIKEIRLTVLNRLLIER